MSRSELSLFSIEILGLVGRRGAGPTTCGISRGAAGSSTGGGEPVLRGAQAPRPPRLPRGPQGAGKTRERTSTRSPTGARRAAGLRAHARTLTPLKSEALLRLLIGDLVGEEVTRESMATLRHDLADLAGRLERAPRPPRTWPHRREVPAAGERLPAPATSTCTASWSTASSASCGSVVRRKDVRGRMPANFGLTAPGLTDGAHAGRAASSRRSVIRGRGGAVPGRRGRAGGMAGLRPLAVTGRPTTVSPRATRSWY